MVIETRDKTRLIEIVENKPYRVIPAQNLVQEITKPHNTKFYITEILLSQKKSHVIAVTFQIIVITTIKIRNQCPALGQ